MALQFTFTDEFGVTHERAYARVIDANYNFESGPVLRATVAVYASQESRQSFRQRWLKTFETTADEFDEFLTVPVTDLRSNVYQWLKSRIPGENEVDFRNAKDT